MHRININNEDTRNSNTNIMIKSTMLPFKKESSDLNVENLDTNYYFY